MSDILIKDKGVVHPLGCPLDAIQLPMCLGMECELWMFCEAYQSSRQGQEDIDMFCEAYKRSRQGEE